MSQNTPLILVADDEVHILHVVSLKLRNAGFEVITAQDGEEALELALEQQPDLLITDYQMPYLTGLELCVKLREHDETRDMPALMLTARGSKLEKYDLERSGITQVLSKPFSPREILGLVQTLIQPKAADGESATPSNPLEEAV